MTTHRHYQLGATAGAIVLGVLAAACIYQGLYAPALGLALGVTVLAEAAAREGRRHRRAVQECEWVRQRALGRNPAPLRPCCLLARASHGAAHDGKCTDLSIDRILGLPDDERDTA